MKSIQVSAEVRSSFGKNAARQVRMRGRIPAVLYGQQEAALSLTVDPKDLLAILHSAAGHNTILSLDVKDQGSTSVILKEWQLDPIKETLLHADFLRIAMDNALQVSVPVLPLGMAKGVKDQGGIFEFVLRQLEVECLPADIPEHITADISDLEIGSNLRVADLTVSPKVKVLSDLDLVVAHVVTPKEEAVEAEEVAEPGLEEEEEPEVIRKGKGESEEGSEG
ncbi:MAG: 50S ribosomal protein L25 [Acidobacteriota bacterium]|nr:50S ribosomal protein L25 [Acidobacteriota bacterium]